MATTFHKYVEADIPVIFWGAPGTGKTAHVTASAFEAGAHLETVILSQLEPSDLIGLPVVAGRDVEFAPPSWARRLRAALDNGKKAWVFFDELSCATPAVQAAALRVIHERKVGDLDLIGCRVLAAANPADSAASHGWLSAPMANRFAHVDFKLSVADWCAGELSGWGGRPAPGAALITAYLSTRPHKVCSEPGADVRAFASPRAWSMASRLGGEPDSVEATTGDVEYRSWYKLRDLRPIEDYLNGHALPKKPDLLAEVLIALCAHSCINTSARPKVWELLGSAPPDLALLPARALYQVDPEVPPAAVKLGQKLLDLGVAK